MMWRELSVSLTVLGMLGAACAPQSPPVEPKSETAEGETAAPPDPATATDGEAPKPAAEPAPTAESETPQAGFAPGEPAPGTNPDDAKPAEEDDGWAESPEPSAKQEDQGAKDDSVVPFVQQNRPKLRACYDEIVRKVTTKRNAFEGEVVIDFTLQPSGKVKSASYNAEKSTLKSDPARAAEVGECMVKELSSWQFPASKRGRERSISYPFQFHYRGVRK